jgi:hypothetical protein
MAIALRIKKKPVESGISQDQLDEEIERYLSNKDVVAAYVERNDDERFLCIVIPSDEAFFELVIQGISAQDYFKGENVQQLIQDFLGGQSLGALSEKYESTGDSKAFGEDPTGGPSYGRYQIATKTGTMKSFLNFLRNMRPDMVKSLNEAGGLAAARKGLARFKDAWSILADDPEFPKIEHAYIRATHYDPFLRRLRGDDGADGNIGLNLSLRSYALQNVAWSTAVQHGPANSIFENALSGVEIDDDALSPSDADIIRAIYDERSKVDIYFASSPDHIKNSVLERFGHELQDALALL